MKTKRTTEDIWKEIAKTYTKLGKLLDELNRMDRKTRDKSKWKNH